MDELPVGFRKTSLIDFPGRLASVIFLPGCDFRCPYCQNAGLVRGGAEGLIPLGAALAHLERRAGLIGGLVLSGGEPLLSSAAPEILRQARRLGLALKLDTNGSRPDRLAALLADPEARPDFLAMDLKTAPSEYGRVTPAGESAGAAVLESLALLRGSGIDYELRLTCAPGVLGEEDAAALAAVLLPEDAVVLQAFRPGGCLDPAWDSQEPTSAGEMRRLLDLIRTRAPRARIRGIA